MSLKKERCMPSHFPPPCLESFAGRLALGVWKRTRNYRSGQCWHCLKSPANKHTNWNQMVKVHFFHVLCGLMIPINIFLLCICSAFVRHLRKFSELSLAFSVLHSKTDFVWSASTSSHICHLYEPQDCSKTVAADPWGVWFSFDVSGAPFTIIRVISAFGRD